MPQIQYLEYRIINPDLNMKIVLKTSVSDPFLNLVRYIVLNSCRIWSPTQLNTPHSLPIHRIRIRIQRFRHDTHPDPRFLGPKPKIDKKNWKRFTAEKIVGIFLTALYLSLGLHKGPSYRRILNLFIFLWAIVVQSGSTDLIESRSKPDLKHC